MTQWKEQTFSQTGTSNWYILDDQTMGLAESNLGCKEVSDQTTSSETMALNFVQFSRCASFFVANQFRVCARYRMKHTYRYYKKYVPTRCPAVSPTAILRGTKCTGLQKSSIDFLRDAQKVSNSATIQKPHKMQTRMKHFGNKSRSCTDVPFLAAKSRKNKKTLSHVQSCIECSQKHSGKDRINPYRPRPLSLPATHLQSDLKLHTIRNSVIDKKCGAHIQRNKLSEVVDNVRMSIKPRTSSRHREIKKLARNQSFNEKDAKYEGYNNKPVKNGTYRKANAIGRSQSADVKNLRNMSVNQDFIISLANVTKDMIEWLKLVRKYLIKMERAQRSEKAKDYPKVQEISKDSTPVPKHARQVTKSHSSPSLIKPEHCIKTSKANSNLSPEKPAYFNVSKLASARSYVDKDSKQMNKETNKHINESNSVKNPNIYSTSKTSETTKESQKLLEIYPKYIDNTRHIPNVSTQEITGLTKSPNNTPKMTASQTMPKKNDGNIGNQTRQKTGFILVNSKSPKVIISQTQKETGFILVDDESPTINRSRLESRTENTIPCKEKGFILIDTQEPEGGTTATSRAFSGEKGFSMVDRNIKSQNSIRRSTQEPRNFVLVNDNPLRSCSTNARESKPNVGPCYKEDIQVVPSADKNENFDAFKDGLLGNMGLFSRREKSNNSKITNPSQSQLIGASDSTEEIHHPCKNPDAVEERFTVLESRGERSDLKDDFLSHSRGLETWSRMVEKTLEDLRSKVQNKASSSENKDVYLTDTYTTKGDNATTGTRQRLQENSDTRSRDMFSNKVQNVIKTRWRQNVETLMENASKGKSAASILSSTNARLQVPPQPVSNKPSMKSSETKNVSKPVSPNTINKGSPNKTNIHSPNKINTGGPSKVNTSSPKRVKRVQAGSPNKLKMNATRWDGLNVENVKYTKSVTAGAAQTKTDLQNITRNPCIKKGVEPQLYVKPQDFSVKDKPISNIRNDFKSPEPDIFTQDTPDNKTSNDALVKWLTSRPFKSSPSVTEKHNGKCKSQTQNNNKYLNDKMKNSDMASKSTTNQSYVVSTLPNIDGSPALQRSISLPDLFLQMQLNKRKKQPLSTKNANKSRKKINHNTHYNAQKSMSDINVAKIKTDPSHRSKELITELQNQWSQDFQEKYRKLQSKRFYSHHFQRNANCLVGTSNDSGSFPGTVSENVRTNPASESTTVRTSSLPFKPRKSEHLHTMGMAERLLSASKPTADIHETGKVPEIKPSISSVTTLTDATQATPEVDDFPEIDQFEEWIQTNMPEIYKDKSQTSVNKGKHIDPPSKNIPPGGLKLSNKDTPGNHRAFEGSSVDGRPNSSMMNRQPKPITFVEPTAEDTVLYNKYYKGTLSNDLYPDSNISNTCYGTVSDVNKCNKENCQKHFGNIIDSPSMTESLVSIAKNSQGSLKKIHPKQIIGARQAIGELDSPTSTFYEDPSPTSDMSNTSNIESWFEPMTLKNSKLFGSLDGFAAMTVVEPSNSPPKTLKSKSKKSTSRERVEDNKASMTTKSWQNNSKTVRAQQVGNMGKISTRIHDSAVDIQFPEGSFAAVKTSKENDPREQLADVRKRADMEARLKTLNEHSNKIREYEAVLSKYRDVVEKFKGDLLGNIRDRGSHTHKSSEV